MENCELPKLMLELKPKIVELTNKYEAKIINTLDNETMKKELDKFFEEMESLIKEYTRKKEILVRSLNL